MEGLLSSMELGFGLILRELSAVLVVLLRDGLCSQFMFQSLQRGSRSWQLVLAASGFDARQLFRGGCCGGGGCSAVPPGGAASAERRPRSVEPSAAATAATGAGPELVRGQVLDVGPRSSSLNREGSYRVVWLIQCDRSHCYESYEKQRAETLAAQIEVKCHLIDQLYAAKQECASMETTLKYAGLEKEPVNVRSLANAYRQLMTVNLNSRKEISFLIEELRKERSLQSIQAEVAEMLKGRTFLEEVTRISTSQGAVTNQPGDRAPSPAGPFPRSGPSC
ncbi:uncharacterized protein LOC116156032 [Camelus dromedarius]|uniref:uncharacterized protein LOC116156032 n=1 Tax=Camelus dromedarius TaxID=9838 RepID=UPI003119277C